MDRRKELKEQYKRSTPVAGVFRILDTVSGKSWLGSSLNMHGPFQRHRFELTVGSHLNRELQQAWRDHGADAFAFEVLETVPQHDDPDYDCGEDLAILELLWQERIAKDGAWGTIVPMKLRH
jgi:hypothetical protein